MGEGPSASTLRMHYMHACADYNKLGGGLTAIPKTFFTFVEVCSLFSCGTRRLTHTRHGTAHRSGAKKKHAYLLTVLIGQLVMVNCHDWLVGELP